MYEMARVSAHIQPKRMGDSDDDGDDDENDQMKENSRLIQLNALTVVVVLLFDRASNTAVCCGYMESCSHTHILPSAQDDVL